MKYLAALLIGIGLLAQNPASAETLKYALEFKWFEETRVKHCYKAAKTGIPIDAPKNRQLFLVSREDFGVWDGTGDTAPWRIYQFRFKEYNMFGYRVSCFFRPLDS